MNANIVPKANALEGVRQFEIYDATPYVQIPYGDDGKGYINFYPDSGVVHIVPDRDGREYTKYNLRTDYGNYEGGNIRERYIDRVEAAMPVLRESGIDIDAIPEGYPEVEQILERTLNGEVVQIEQLGNEDNRGCWFVVTETRRVAMGTGTAQEYHLFKLETVENGVDRQDEKNYAVHAEIIGPPKSGFGDDTRGWHIKENWAGKVTYPLKRNELSRWSFDNNDNREFVVEDRSRWGKHIYRDDVVFHKIDESSAQELLRFQDPEIDRTGSVNDGREKFVLLAALNGLQYSRWSEWDDWDQVRDIDLANKNEVRTINYRQYEGAITELVERFGEDFFCEIAWQTMASHLGGLHSQEIMKTSPYKAHADVSPFGRSWMRSAQIVTGGKHPLPDDMRDSGIVVNAMPLYGDADFWKIIKAHYPDMFKDLAQRWLELPDDTKQHGIYATAVVHPRALLSKHFPETYRFLTDNEPRFIAPIGAVAIDACTSSGNPA